MIAALVLSTWRNLVQSLCIGLTANPWIVRSSVLVALVLVTAAFPIAWAVLTEDRFQAFVWNNLPWILAILVSLKCFTGAWAAIQLFDRKILSDRAIVAGAMLWLAAVAAVYALFAWIAASPVFPFYSLGAMAILSVPLARLAAAPLALESSRHR